jgi:anti-sigma B factor antagonist
MANLNIKERQIGNITILDIEGNIRIGEANIALRNAIRQLVKEGKHQILLNLSEATYIDSSGLGEFVSGYVALNKLGGKLKLVNLTERVNELMTITKLRTVFDVYDNESEAIGSFVSRINDALEVAETRPKFVN